ncbi:three-helix bundle dimerization domain-containing protein [Arthrobacter sp. KNU-44]|uniref:three-helix bundle dimerization domain-containing protein n=1 Tax=unclassified Arthrobacter TaxID=235627 RepID=UPI003F4354C7
MIRDDEARALVAVINHLIERFPDIPRSVVENVVAEEHSSLSGGRIRDYVPVLVEHAAKKRLAKVADGVRFSEGFSSELVGGQPSIGNLH